MKKLNRFVHICTIEAFDRLVKLNGLVQNKGMNVTEAVRNNPERADKILAGARAVFAEDGFEGASVDDIAARAGVSKATLYRYFPDKRALFQAYVAAECRKQANHTFSIELSEAGIEQTLRDIAHQFVGFLLSDFAIEMFRVAFSEVRRFPEIGREFYDSGPANAHRRLSQLLAAGTVRGELEVEDPDFAAEQFTELCKSDLYLKLLLGVRTSVTEKEVQRVADAAVDVFMRAYEAPQPN